MGSTGRPPSPPSWARAGESAAAVQAPRSRGLRGSSHADLGCAAPAMQQAGEPAGHGAICTHVATEVAPSPLLLTSRPTPSTPPPRPCQAGLSGHTDWVTRGCAAPPRLLETSERAAGKSCRGRGPQHTPHPTAPAIATLAPSEERGLDPSGPPSPTRGLQEQRVLGTRAAAGNTRLDKLRSRLPEPGSKAATPGTKSRPPSAGRALNEPKTDQRQSRKGQVLTATWPWPLLRLCPHTSLL